MAIENKTLTDITAKQISQIFGLPIDKATLWQASLWPVMKKYQINNILRASMFFGNLSVESSNLTKLQENLNYSAERLVVVFPNIFSSAIAAAPYAHNPEKCANKIYANKIGNGPESSGDGFRYAGKGAIQLTGKENYTNCSRGEIPCTGDNASVLATIDGAARSAAWFWGSRGINRYADQGDFKTAVKRVNTASLEYAKREAAYQRAVQVLSGTGIGIPVQVQPSNTGSVTQKATPDAANSSLSEPAISASPEYPHNKVYQSPGGHVIEIDDTPGNERLHVMHMGGSYIEFLASGDVVIKAVKDLYLIAGGDLKTIIKGDSTASIGGQSYEKSGTKVISTGDMTIESSDLQVNAPSTFSLPMNATTIDVQGITAVDIVTNTETATITTTGSLVVGAGGGTAPKMTIVNLTATDVMSTSIESVTITAPTANIPIMNGTATLAHGLTP